MCTYIDNKKKRVSNSYYSSGSSCAVLLLIFSYNTDTRTDNSWRSNTPQDALLSAYQHSSLCVFTTMIIKGLFLFYILFLLPVICYFFCLYICCMILLAGRKIMYTYRSCIYPLVKFNKKLWIFTFLYYFNTMILKS